jgi:uncharacterized protein (TIGR02301 family)
MSLCVMSLRAIPLALVLAASTLAGAPAARAQEAGPPLETLSELAELLGRAHAIRSACNGDSDQTWRTYMFNMLAIEAPSGSPRKAALTGAFNRGFRDQAARSGRCTADSQRAEAEIAARGRALAETVAGSYLH